MENNKNYGIFANNSKYNYIFMIINVVHNALHFNVYETETQEEEDI